MDNILFIWDQCGIEPLWFYVVPVADLDTETAAALEKANGEYMNNDNEEDGVDEALDLLCALTAEKPEHCEGLDADKKYHCAWKKYEAGTEAAPIVANISKVYHAGFIP